MLGNHDNVQVLSYFEVRISDISFTMLICDRIFTICHKVSSIKSYERFTSGSSSRN